LVHDLREAGARLLTDATATEVDDASVRVTTAAGVEHVPAGLVAVASGATARAPLADELRGAGVTVHVVGDARDVRLLEGAELDATELAMALG
jgi:hypothetical protein